MRDLNFLYRREPCLYAEDFESSGFEWAVVDDADNSIVGFFRYSEQNAVLVVCNLTPITRVHYRLGVPFHGFWKEILNSDATEYDGSGQGNLGGVHSKIIPSHGHPYSISATLPGISSLFFRLESIKDNSSC